MRAVVDQRAGNLDPTLHAGGQGAHQPSAPLRQFHQLEHLLDPLPPQLAGNAVDQTVKVQVLVHVRRSSRLGS